MVNGNIVNSAEDSLLIKLVAAYKLLKHIVSYEDHTIGEDSENYFKKWFRWSTDNTIFSDWIILSNINLNNLNLDPDNDFWIEYKYDVQELNTGHTLEFKSIALEVVTRQGRLLAQTQVSTSACDPSDSHCFGNLIIEDCCDKNDNIFKPYSLLTNANCFYDQLSKLTSDIFGHCVKYYRIEPDKDSEDFIFKEYSMFNRNTAKDIKVLVPDNEFPPNDFQFDPFGGMNFEGFEIHITRQEFEEAFGAKQRPRERDSMYFPINQRMYTVNSVALADEINAMHTYFKIKLRKFEDSKNINDTPEISKELDDLVVSMEEIVNDKVQEEVLKVTKPQQYKTIGTDKNDYVRSDLNVDIKIVDEKINNNWTIVSKNYYNLSKLSPGVVAIKYRLSAKLTSTENRAYTAWFKPQFKTSKAKLNISAFTNSSGKLQVGTINANGLSINDRVEIFDAIGYSNMILTVISIIDDTNFILDLTYDPLISSVNTKVQLKERATLLYGYNTLITNSDIGMSIEAYKGYIVVSINDKEYFFKLNESDYTTAVWYSFIVNLSNKFNTLSTHVYKLEKQYTYTNPQAEDSSLTPVGYEIKTNLENIEFNTNSQYTLLGSPLFLTNVRIFDLPIEEEEQQNVLNQLVVYDTQHALLVDNALNQLKLLKMENPR